jgi:hypothetical protein
MRHLPCEVAVLLLACLSFASAQDITLRLVNAKSGKPLSKIAVSMHAWNGTLDIHKPSDSKHVIVGATTDADGIAVFHLPQPAPEHLGFNVCCPWDLAGCWHLSDVSPDTVLREGTVAEYNDKCGKLRRPISAKPGEVVIAERKLTLWEKMRREIP